MNGTNNCTTTSWVSRVAECFSVITRLILAESIPPPFIDFNVYYIIPKSFEKDLKALALSDAETKTDAAPTDLQLDMTGLVESVHPEQVHVIQTTAVPDGSLTLGGPYKEAESYWTLKDGLVEDDDFLFIHQSGWEKIMEWQVSCVLVCV